MRRAALPLLIALAACDRQGVAPDSGARAAAAPSPPSAPSPSAARAAELLPPRARWAPTDDERALSACALADLRRSPSLPAFYEATCAGASVLWLPATAAQPARHRAQLALYRLATVARLDVVPTSAARSDTRATLLSLLPARDVAALADDPSGRVASAITRVPDGVIVRTLYGTEAARWRRLVERSDPPDSADARTADDWQRVAVLDYVTANLFRDGLLLAPDGRLWMLDGSTAFYEHPSPGAADQLLDRVKRARRAPPGLADALSRLSRDALDDALRAGDYDEWLLHHRAIGEVALRARAAHGWALAADAPR